MRLIFSTIIFLLTCTFSFVLGQNKMDRKLVLEAFIDEYHMVNDTVVWAKEIQKYTSFPKNLASKDDLELVSTVLWAQAYARTLDQLNSQSDSLFQAAIQTAKENNKIDLYIWANMSYGFYLYTYRLPAKAMPYYVQVMQDIKRMSPSSMIQAGDTYKKIGYFLSTLGDYKEAIVYLKLAQKNVKTSSKDYGIILNCIGRCYFRIQDHKQAEVYYQIALKSSHQMGDVIRQAKIYGDLAEVYQVHQEFDRAEEALMKDISLSEQSKNPQNTMYAKILLGRLMLAQNKLAEASQALEAAFAIAKSKTYFKSSEYEIVKLQINLYHKQRDDQKELAARRRLDILENEIALTDGQRMLKQLSIETQKEILNLNLEAERNKHRQETLIRRSVVTISLLLFITLIFVVISFRRRNKLRLTTYENRVMKLHLEKVTSENKLNETRKTLSAYRVYLSDKNDQIETLQREIENNNNSSLSTIESNNGKLQELLQSHLMSEENWQTFKEVFIQEEPDYYHYILEHFQGLTDSNLRIIFLQKMGFNNPRIAQILGITLDAVKKNKQRMRKKYGALYDAYSKINKEEEEAKVN
jgi:tetratricopeptide (TPR) repeat protein/DNA-directed RNA polymerase specialized sigma24 family protein